MESKEKWERNLTELENLGYTHRAVQCPIVLRVVYRYQSIATPFDRTIRDTIFVSVVFVDHELGYSWPEL